MNKSTPHRLSVSMLRVAAAALVSLGLTTGAALAQVKEPSKLGHTHDHPHAKHGMHGGEKANGSGVTFKSTTPKSLAIGERGRVTITLDGATQDGAVASLRAPEGMTMTRVGGGSLDNIALAKGKTTDVTVEVSSTVDGMQYFDVLTKQGDRASIKQVAVKVGSGVVRLKSNGEVITTPTGERIVSMPAK